ncbi:hypothetical protein Efla_005158 [Eimeria flavescens]
MATSEKLTQIATNIVLEKAAKDKLTVLRRQQEGTQTQSLPQDGGTSAPQQEEEAVEEGFDELSHWRERRMQQLKLARQRQTALREKGHGEYSEIAEAEFLSVVTTAPRAVGPGCIANCCVSDINMLSNV